MCSGSLQGTRCLPLEQIRGLGQGIFTRRVQESGFTDIYLFGSD